MPRAAAPALQAWLQDFAWTEEEHGRRLAERRVQRGVARQLRSASMFCFETAIRMFYWSTLVRSALGLLCTAPVADHATSPCCIVALHAMDPLSTTWFFFSLQTYRHEVWRCLMAAG